MPRTAIDYSKSLIYKICPIDKKIEECYIGSTTSFSRRKYDHKSACNNIISKGYSKPLYKHIRENGGWDAFEMVLIEYYPCGSSLELRQREEFWRSTLKAELNAVRCYTDGKCKIDDCENVVVNNGLCKKHGAKRNECKIDNCNNQVVNNGLCIKHGAKRNECKIDNCTNHSQNNGVCMKHGAKRIECKIENCNNKVQTNGVCMKHGAKRYECKIENCTNHSQNNGLCKKHGAIVKRCKIENCTNQVQKNNGLCRKHGPKITCKCGSIISEHGFKAHLKTKKHIAHEKNYFQKEFNFIL